MLTAKQIMEYVQATKAASEKKQFSVDEARQIGETLGICWDTFDVQQFTIGMNVECEHGRKNSQTDVTDDAPMRTGKIALPHLREIPDYYTRRAATVVRRGLSPDSASRRPAPCAATLMNRTEKGEGI